MGSIPNGSAPLQACARLIFNSNASGPHREGASSISRGGALAQCRGFGTCGWKGVGTPEIRPNSARGILRRNGTGHPEWVRCHGPRAGRRFPPRLRKGGAASVLGRLGNPSSRSWRSEYPLLAQDGEAGPRAGLSRPGQPRRQSDGSRSTVSAVPLPDSADPVGYGRSAPARGRAPACDC